MINEQETDIQTIDHHQNTDLHTTDNYYETGRRTTKAFSIVVLVGFLLRLNCDGCKTDNYFLLPVTLDLLFSLPTFELLKRKYASLYYF